jgi:hypothetical protein
MIQAFPKTYWPLRGWPARYWPSTAEGVPGEIRMRLEALAVALALEAVACPVVGLQGAAGPSVGCYYVQGGGIVLVARLAPLAGLQEKE